MNEKKREKKLIRIVWFWFFGRALKERTFFVCYLKFGKLLLLPAWYIYIHFNGGQRKVKLSKINEALYDIRSSSDVFWLLLLRKTTTIVLARIISFSRRVFCRKKNRENSVFKMRIRAKLRLLLHVNNSLLTIIMQLCWFDQNLLLL